MNTRSPGRKTIPAPMEIPLSSIFAMTLDVVGLNNLTKYQNKHCFYSDPDRQNILVNGTPKDVKNHINDIIKALCTPKGGLVGCVYITKDTPLENIKAALDTFTAYQLG